MQMPQLPMPLQESPVQLQADCTSFFTDILTAADTAQQKHTTYELSRMLVIFCLLVQALLLYGVLVPLKP